jgi:Ala-tRNA(Pro) deacylase
LADAQHLPHGRCGRGTATSTSTRPGTTSDKKSRLFLLSAHEDTVVDLKTLHTKIGAQGRLGFAAPEVVRTLLDVEPGTVTPLALLNDTDGAITFIIEEDLLEAEQMNFHPSSRLKASG